MDRTAVFVDAGYLFASGSKLIANEKLPRGQLNLDYDAILKLLGDLVTEITGLPLLRIYWYDGASTGPTAQQVALAYRPNVKLRLGSVNQHGEQKGVDSLIVTDLINLARNRAMADAVLFTGDEDLRVGVQQAAEFGVRVHLIGIAPSRENLSGLLVQDADTLRELTLGEVQTFLSRTSLPACAASVVTVATSFEAAAERIANELYQEEIEAVLRECEGGAVPSFIDRRLLLAGSHASGGAELSSEQKRRLRAAFLEECQKVGKR